MHLIIIFGGSLLVDSAGSAVIVPFILMKTVADALMHYTEHRILSKPAV